MLTRRHVKNAVIEILEDNTTSLDPDEMFELADMVAERLTEEAPDSFDEDEVFVPTFDPDFEGSQSEDE